MQHASKAGTALRSLFTVTPFLVALCAPGVLDAATTWDGSTDTDWFTSANWSAGIPDSADDVTIPNGLGTYPVLNASGAVCKSLTIGSTSTLDLDTYTIDIHKFFTPNATDVVLSTATGRLNFTGNGDEGRLSNAIIFSGDIECSKTGAKFMDIRASWSFNDLIVTSNTCNATNGTHTQTISGDVTVASGATLDRKGATLDIAGSVTITGTWDDTDASGATNVGGNWTDTGTFTIGTQTVTFNGGGTSTISTSGSGDFYNVTITNSTTVQAISAIGIDNNITINSGSTFDRIDEIIDINGNVTISGTWDDSDATGSTTVAGNWTDTGTFTTGTQTVTFDGSGTSTVTTPNSSDFYNLTVNKSGGAQVLTASNVDIDNDLTVTAGELEIGDTYTLNVDNDISVTGTLDVEPDAKLAMAAATVLTVNSGGTFEAIGTPTAYAEVTASDTATPGRYTFTIAAGGIMNADRAFFTYMDSSGIQITDDGTVTALTSLDYSVFDHGAAGGRLLKITNNDNTVTLAGCIFEDTTTTPTYNVETVSATATISMDPYAGDLGGAANENDNGGGQVDPGFIVWSVITPVLLGRFEAEPVAGGVQLEWTTLSEWRVHGFCLERAPWKSRDFEVLNPSVILPTGGGGAGSHYRVIDDDADPRSGHRYRLVEIDLNGVRQVIARTRVKPVPGKRRLRPPRTPGRPLSSFSPGSGPQRVAASVAREQRSSRWSARGAGRAHFFSGQRPVTTVKILVEGEGVYRVERGQLEAAGFPVDRDPERFSLRRGTEPWPLAIVGAEDGEFDAIDFIAPPFESLETRFDVYWLGIGKGGSSALRIPDVEGMPGSVVGSVGSSQTDRTYEEDSILVLSLSEAEGRDHWFWAVLVAPGSVEIPFEIDTVLLGPAEVEIRLEGITNDLRSPVDHRTLVFVNGVEVGELESNGPGPYGGTLRFPGTMLGEGTNTLLLEAESLGSTDIAYLDGFRVSYLRSHRNAGSRIRFQTRGGLVERIEGFTGPDIVLYQVSGPDAPRRVLGADIGGDEDGYTLRFLPPDVAPADFVALTPEGLRAPTEVVPAIPRKPRDPARGADYIIVCPERFLAEVEPLADLREALGLRVEVVPVERIYDHYAGGRVTTMAIREFLRHAWEEWRAPAPRFVLLVGDATYDPLEHLGPSDRQILPTRLIETPDFQTASDAWFVDFEPADGVPEMAIGRLPVATAEECEAVVDKILAYERQSTLGDWSSRAIVVSDAASEFEIMNDDIEPLFPADMEVLRLDLGALELDELRDVLLEHWSAGVLAVHYAGHGGRRQWSSAGILVLDDLEDLENGPRLPIVTAMNCWNGFFHHPSSASLGEQLLLEPDGGAIAYWGPTGVSTHIGQGELATEFYEALFDPANATLGSSIRTAKQQFRGIEARRVHLDTWILLGDPALRIR